MNGHVKDVRAVDGGVIVEVTGEVTLNDSPKFHGRLLQVLETSPERLIIDLSAVTHIDSAGVGTLVEIFRRIKAADGKMFLVGLQPRVRGVFEITKLDRFFPILNSTDEALKS
ncbi:MAG TPA: STAS domain-containing protein [Phycisphaerae bacterium]|nr:STAS domain-containing protein [Phycisphaerae bacterium]